MLQAGPCRKVEWNSAKKHWEVRIEVGEGSDQTGD